MAKRLSISEEQAITDYMRAYPSASDRHISRVFARSRPLVADLRRRYGLDKPAPPKCVEVAKERAPSFDFQAEMEQADASARDQWAAWQRGEDLPTYGRPEGI